MGYLLALLAVVAGVMFMAHAWQRRQALHHAIDHDLPVGRWLDADLPWRQCLTAPQRQHHERQVRDLLKRVAFYGCQGQEVSARMRVVLAGLACLLTLRQRGRVYAQLRSILVYPAAFWVCHELPDDDGLVTDDEVLQLGESQSWGRVVLSWEDVESALAGDTVNVAVHEFAHQLDDDFDVGEGTPDGADPEQWPAIMQHEFAALGQTPSPVLDDYGLEGPGEFFAVTVEAFFQQPDALSDSHPALYELLCDTFGVDWRGVAFTTQPD